MSASKKGWEAGSWLQAPFGIDDKPCECWDKPPTKRCKICPSAVSQFLLRIPETARVPEGEAQIEHLCCQTSQRYRNLGWGQGGLKGKMNNTHFLLGEILILRQIVFAVIHCQPLTSTFAAWDILRYSNPRSPTIKAQVKLGTIPTTNRRGTRPI